MNLQKEFLEFVKKNHLFDRDDKVLLTVSGGLDSVVMADLFSKSGLDFGIAHCNFHLRGEESDEDELYVKGIAAKYGKPFYVNHFNTKEYSEKQGISIQMAARELRYTWFETLRETKEYAVIATAHHLDDSIETILYNFFKGSGIEGLKGIPAINGNVVRPLLFASRKNIEDYAMKNKLQWREDSSNRSSDYARNKIRNEIIPLIEEINPGFGLSIIRSVDRLKDIGILLERYISEIRERIIRVEGENLYIKKDIIFNLNSASLLFSIIKDYGFIYEQAGEILGRIGEQPGKIFLSEDYMLVIDRKELIVTAKDLSPKIPYFIEEDQKFLDAPDLKLRFKKMDFIKIEKKLPSNIVWIDFDKLFFPLKVRAWEEGDKFYPLGMKGKKKLSDFMIDIKIPLNLKRQIKVLESGQDIVWVVGLRLDDRFKLTESTRYVYQIEYINPDEKPIQKDI